MIKRALFTTKLTGDGKVHISKDIDDIITFTLSGGDAEITIDDKEIFIQLLGKAELCDFKISNNLEWSAFNGCGDKKKTEEIAKNFSGLSFKE